MSLALSLQSAFTLFWMLYAWNNPEHSTANKYPKVFLKPKYSFTALIPARHEYKVIADTIRAVDAIEYPEKLKEILVLCRADDKKTIEMVNKTRRSLRKKRIKLVVFDSYPINKPHSLNVGLKKASGEIIGIFDAEDHPHKAIYNVINTIFQKERVDVVQSGIQLINYNSRWFSIVNVMEYFFWFKSGLLFFTHFGKLTPLAGNSVFMQKKMLKKVNGWNERILTEDAEIGFQLVLHGAKIKVIYDENHATLEETPHTVNAFIKQRTRWNQGFLQIFLTGCWLQLPLFRQKIIAMYILFTPIMQSLLAWYIPFSLLLEFLAKFPVSITLFSLIPLYLFLLQVTVYSVCFLDYKEKYAKHAPWWLIGKIVVVFYFYQLLLSFSACRACYRIVRSHNGWEKTHHLNHHRNLALNLSYAS